MARRLTQQELARILDGIALGTELRTAFAQLLAERTLLEMAVPYLRELCAEAGPRRAGDPVLDNLCSELGSDRWRDAPGWFEDPG